ncbi:MAG: SHOCT domain-containing protein [Flavobacteriaceae bacterium]|nr:SHOCT domain-containing protein [Flavobacteriaceae bacterium]
MSRKAYIKPTKPSLIVGMIVVVFMFIFGIFFISLLVGESDSHIGIGFLSIWLLVLLLIGGSFAYNYINYDKNPASSVAEEIQMEDGNTPLDTSMRFDEKLRKLDQLKNEKLLSEAEYEVKRKEILDQKW